MLRNYLKIFWRSALREKFYVMAVIVGLTTAFTACLLIFLYVYDEHTYDQFHEYSDRIVRVGFTRTYAGEPFRDYYTPPEAGPLFAEIPEVQELARIHKVDPVVRHRDNLFQETELIFATENFFEVFNYQFLEGDPNTALRDKYSIVLTENRTRRYFGNGPALGKTLILNKEGVYTEQPFIVTGVIRDIPRNTSFNYDMVLSHQSMKGHYPGDLSEVWAASFILLREGAALEDVASKLPGLNETYFTKQGESGSPGDQGFILQPIADVHLAAPFDREWIPGGGGGNVQYLIILMTIGAGLLLIACVNYINLSTARSAGKTRDIGIRKAVGALRNQLVGQHLLESILVCAVSMALAFILSWIGVHVLNQVSAKSISYGYLFQWPVVGSAFLAVLVVGMLAGGYPAYYIALFNSIDALKGGLARGKEKGIFRRVLVVAQYAVSAILIMFSLHVYSQLQYMKTKDLGFDREALLVLDRGERLGTQRDPFLQQIKLQSSVIDAGISGTFPGRTWGSWKEMFYERPADVPERGEDPESSFYDPYVYLADAGFAEAMDLEFVAGRNFYPGRGPDSAAALVNEAAVRAFGWTDPVGKRIYRREARSYRGDNDEMLWSTFVKEFEIVGVFKDFNYFSLQAPVEPLIVLTGLDGVPIHTIMVRIAPGSLEETVADLEKTWREFLPQSPMVYYFVDQELDALYRHHTRFGILVGFFTLLSLLVAGLGMLGLAAYTAETRTKEIGVRKALGASVTDIVYLLTKDTLKWVGLACLIGLPVGFLLTRDWLQNFAYHVNIGPLVILLAVLGAAGIALLSVSARVIRAAGLNPVDTLRQE